MLVAVANTFSLFYMATLICETYSQLHTLDPWIACLFVCLFVLGLMVGNFSLKMRSYSAGHRVELAHNYIIFFFFPHSANIYISFSSS